MPFRDILGQASAVETLCRALEAGKVHHAYRFEGPDGVGKEKAAFALAQCLQCPSPVGYLSCRTCSACTRAVTLTEEPPCVPIHPDVVLLQRGLYSAASLGADTPETNTINLPQVRKLVKSRVGFAPHEGRALVFIIRQADELNTHAANALLKILEEPPERTYFLLLTSRPHRLLDTIRSRTLAVRFAPLSDDVLGAILDRHGVSREVIPAASGSASLALALADEQGLRAKQAFTQALDEAIDAGDLSSAIARLEVKGSDRGELRDHLGWFALHLASQSRGQLEDLHERAERHARMYRIVLGTMGELERNANPTLALEAMVTRLRRV
jgi:DNA polymerase-3 subunit delta'